MSCPTLRDPTLPGLASVPPQEGTGSPARHDARRPPGALATGGRRVLASLLAGLCLALPALLPAPVCAQGLPLALSANQLQLARLAVGVPSGQLSFAIDAGTKTVLVDIASTVPNLVTSLELPNGGLINEGNVSGVGGSFSKSDGTAGSGPTLYPMTGGGTHFTYRLPLTVAGNLRVSFATPTPLAADAAVVVQLLSDSPLATRLFFTENQVVAGRPTVLAAAVLNGKAAVGQASVQVQMLSDTGLVGTLTLADDGGTADGVAGDGIYSGLFTPPGPGRYRAAATITGSANGAPFLRQSAALVDAVAASGTLTGTVLGRGIDLNANGALDRIALDAGVNITQPGSYRVFLQLSANGKQLVGSGDAVLGAGAQTISALFDTQALVDQGLNQGPYALDLVELRYLAGGQLVAADRKANLGSIGNFQASSFERPVLRLTGVTSDNGLDTNGNGLFDQLRVRVQVDVLNAGSYQFSGRLTDQYGQALDLVAGSAGLGAGLNTLEFVFSGGKIGGAGTSGPYLLDSVLLFSGNRSLSSAAPVAGTQAYAYTQFENATRRPTDLNNDGLINCSDVAIVKAAFGKRSGQVGFDARADLNLDGLINIIDLSTVTRTLPIGLRCP